MKTIQNYINHIALVLDASSSMKGAAAQLVKVADNQIAYLARRSKELDQETRVTIYSFSEKITCLVYDKDVLRLPSIAGLYAAQGNTALIDATLKALEDLAKTPQIYGEHAFLTYVMTDGEENQRPGGASELSRRLNGLPENWTVAVFVPNANGIHEAKKFGFPKDNIAVWDSNSAQGIAEAGETIRQTTESFMQARTRGVRGSRNLFNLNVDTLSKTAVAGNLKELHRGQYRVYKGTGRTVVDGKTPIADFVEAETGRPYKSGEAYYQLTKPEKIQAGKSIALRDIKKHSIYVGDHARTLLGLPDTEVKVSPASHPDYEVFVQSKSVNRNLVEDTTLLLLS